MRTRQSFPHTAADELHWRTKKSFSTEARLERSRNPTIVPLQETPKHVPREQYSRFRSSLRDAENLCSAFRMEVRSCNTFPIRFVVEVIAFEPRGFTFWLVWFIMYRFSGSGAVHQGQTCIFKKSTNRTDTRAPAQAAG